MWDKFIEAVGRHFHFLETEFAFIRTSAKPPFVIFESDKLQVMVFYDVSRGHELDLVMRRVGDDPRKPLSIGIEMLIELRGGCATNYLTSHPSTEAALEAEVKHFAELLRKYGTTVLKGDLQDFDRAERVAQDIAKKL